ncbi:hypothetical protein BDR06DRAFT_954658, partial [Suillus hirtellus]
MENEMNGSRRLVARLYVSFMNEPDKDMGSAIKLLMRHQLRYSIGTLTKHDHQSVAPNEIQTWITVLGQAN